MNTTLFRRWPLLLGAFLALNSVSARAHPVGRDMAAAASRFLASLNPEQRAKAVFALKDDERLNWHFVPKERKGLTLKEMTAEQRPLALALLAAGLSRPGYQKATNIMSLELVLADIEGPNRRFPRDPALYHFHVFGEPSEKGTWAWRVEGHHFSASFTVVDGDLFASTPSFLGTNPAEVRQGPRTGVRVLAKEEDIARNLLKTLDEAQRKEALIAVEAPKDILTEAKRQVSSLGDSGLTYEHMRRDQRALLLDLIGEYVGRVRPELAKTDLARIKKAGYEHLRFAWAGGTKRGEGHYYRVQGPTFLLEYDNTQNDANHIHAVWRDFQRDFGEDLLSKHYAEQPHGK